MFIPDWAAKTLGPKPTPAVDNAELELLREFFNCWESLHALPPADKRNPKNRRDHEEAAQRLVDAAHAVRLMRDGSGLTHNAQGVKING